MVSKQQKEQKKKEWNSFYVEIELEEGTSAEYDGRVLTVTGPKGSISKRLKYPYVNIKVENNKVVIGSEEMTKREKKIILTYQAHAKNMVKGVTIGFEYKLAVVYAKFPMTVENKNNVFTVKNLLGEKVPRTLVLPEDVDVKISGKDITVTGIDKEKTGQVAANIEQLCRVTNMDRRVVQDGIYITKKPHKEYV